MTAPEAQAVVLMVLVFGPISAVGCATAPRLRGIQDPARTWFLRGAIGLALLGAAGGLAYVIIYLATGATAA
jgi:hypothetical protein